MSNRTRAYRAYADEGMHDTPRMPERKRSRRARTESIERRQARALKYTTEVAR